jgi:hypothetical protein
MSDGAAMVHSLVSRIMQMVSVRDEAWGRGDEQRGIAAKEAGIVR